MSASVKTAISMQQHLFDDVNELAKELDVSRSKLFVIEIEEFIKKNENKKMLSQINAAFSDSPDTIEAETISIMKESRLNQYSCCVFTYLKYDEGGLPRKCFVKKWRSQSSQKKCC